MIDDRWVAATSLAWITEKGLNTNHGRAEMHREQDAIGNAIYDEMSSGQQEQLMSSNRYVHL